MSDTARIDKVVLVDDTLTERGEVQRQFAGPSPLQWFSIECGECEDHPASTGDVLGAVTRLIAHLSTHGVEA